MIFKNIFHKNKGTGHSQYPHFFLRSSQWSSIKLLVWSMIIFSLAACNRTRVYDESHTFEGDVWSYNDSVTFNFEIKDTSKLYTFGLNVTHSDAFPYENCYVKINSLYPNKTLKSDVLSLELADETGLWMGQSKGKYFEAPIALQPKAKFNIAGPYKMTFYQHTRRDSIVGIHSMELTLDYLVEK